MLLGNKVRPWTDGMIEGGKEGSCRVVCSRSIKMDEWICLEEGRNVNLCTVCVIGKYLII